MEMSIRMNTKKIAENDNETTSMLDEYTKSTTFKDAFSKNLNEEVTLLKSENRALKKILEKLNKSMEEKDATLSEMFTKNLNKETSELKEKLEKLTKMIPSLRDEFSEKTGILNQEFKEAQIEIKGETTSLKMEIEELKKEEKGMNEKITSLENIVMIGGWKVCTI